MFLTSLFLHDSIKTKYTSKLHVLLLNYEAMAEVHLPSWGNFHLIMNKLGHYEQTDAISGNIVNEYGWLSPNHLHSPSSVQAVISRYASHEVNMSNCWRLRACEEVRALDSNRLFIEIQLRPSDTLRRLSLRENTCQADVKSTPKELCRMYEYSDSWEKITAWI